MAKGAPEPEETQGKVLPAQASVLTGLCLELDPRST